MRNATVVANGTLTAYHGVNYLLIKTFRIVPAQKPAGDARPKVKAAGKDKAPP
jgi:hypothetical protein